MFRVRRRGTTRTAVVALALLVTSWVAVPTTAGAGSIAQTRAEIANLSNELSQQERTSETTANEYDADKAEVTTLNTNIVNLQSEVRKKRAVIAVTAKKLEVDVVRAYVYGAAGNENLPLFNQNVTKSDELNVYQGQVIGSLNLLEHTFVREKKALQTTVAHVASERSRAEHSTTQMRGLLADNVATENETQTELATVTAALRSQIIAYEVAAGVAAAKAGNVAGEEAAIAAASAVGGQAAANQVTEAIQAAIATPTIAEVAGTAQGAAAVRYAKSQIGVHYVWGGETPGVGFDCSGLVQWAWAKAGITIPRTTETQWPDMLHVPLQALQPGDLLFYFNLDGDHEVDHVVMYVGAGPWGVDTIIAAAHTGTNVSLAPLFTAGLIGAARP